jgi:hypothetical protein
MDSRLRGNDNVSHGKSIVIPAQAGIHVSCHLDLSFVERIYLHLLK